MNVRRMHHLTVQGSEALTAEMHASHWLAKGNEQAERGNHEKAEELYEKAQIWLDRANDARGWS